MNDEYLGIFRYFQKKRRPVKLVNNYKGLPIVSEGQVRSVSENSMLIQVEPSQIFCLHTDQKTYIQDEFFSSMVEAQVEKLNILTGEAILTDFRYSSPGIGQRRHIRVVPEEPIASILLSADRQEMVAGYLADLSRSGLAVTIPRLHGLTFIELGRQAFAQVQLPVLEKDAHIELDGLREQDPGNSTYSDIDQSFANLERFLYKTLAADPGPNQHWQISGGYSEITVHGLITNIFQIDDLWDRVGLQLAQRYAANELINRFINFRQSDIIHEMKTAYVEQLQQHSE